MREPGQAVLPRVDEAERGALSGETLSDGCAKPSGRSGHEDRASVEPTGAASKHRRYSAAVSSIDFWILARMYSPARTGSNSGGFCSLTQVGSEVTT